VLPNDDAVWIHHYRLRSKRGPLNSIARRSDYEGVLIRHRDGHACIHPWPELGDPPLAACLADLAGPRRRSLVRRALRCAEMDRVAREFHHSLFEDLEIPASHATLSQADPKAILAAREAGFDRIKLKGGRAPETEAAFLNTMAAEHPALRWRVDCNEAFEPDAAEAFLSALAPAIRRALDFIEDPCPFAETTWSRLHTTHRVALAVDREASPLTRAAQFMVIKPAMDEPLLLAESALQNGQRVVVTSAMDHPVGQAFAAWEAARLALQMPGLVDVCGLQTHHLFEPDPFTELLGPWTPDFHPPEGHGIGFDDLLEILPWKRLF
jgi:O-succinylbenzoate synthase